PSEMPSVYRAHDVLVFPSIGPEGFPMTLLEGAACGIAIVGTTTGGSGEFLVHDETGLVFEPGDAAQLAAQLAALRDRPERRLHLAAAAQRRARTEFGIQRIVAQTEAYLTRIAA